MCYRFISPSKDPDEFIKEYGDDEFNRRILDAKEYVISLYELLKKEYDIDDLVQYEE